jgi:hypothetical protein
MVARVGATKRVPLSRRGTKSDNGGTGSFYRCQHELIFVFKDGDVLHRNNVQLGNLALSNHRLQIKGGNTISMKDEEGIEWIKSEVSFQ